MRRNTYLNTRMHTNKHERIHAHVEPLLVYVKFFLRSPFSFLSAYCPTDGIRRGCLDGVLVAARAGPRAYPNGFLCQLPVLSVSPRSLGLGMPMRIFSFDHIVITDTDTHRR